MVFCARWKWLFQGLGVILVAWPSATVFAEDAQVAWKLRGVVGLPSKTLIGLAESGEPIWHKSDGTAQTTLRKLLGDVCGEQQPEVQQYLESQVVKLNGAENLDDIVERNEAAAVPFCLKIEKDVSVLVAENESPSEILKREYGVFGSKTMQAFYERNASTYDFASVDDFAKHLPAGKRVVVPFSAPERIYQQDVAADKSIEEILSALDGTKFKSQVENTFAPVEVTPQAESHRLAYVQSVEFTDAVPTDGCRGKDGEVASIADISSLQARFDAESQSRALLFGEPPTATIVGIIDSGLGSIGDDFFHENFFVANPVEKAGVTGVDDDNPKNGSVDDVYGTNFSARTGLITPIAADRNRAHGTKMAALVLGGLDIAQEWTAKFTSPMVRLKIVNFSNTLPALELVDASKLPEAIDYLRGQKVSIVSMSFTTNAELMPLRRIFQYNAQLASGGILFVAAAGNVGTGGIDLSGEDLYPARYGGSRGFDEVMSIGASDLSGKRAGFSNYSWEFVDLLAPGCAVETRTDMGTKVLDNGTSPATAIVAFTASLVKSLGVDEPGAIKNRLLAATDFDSTLDKEVWSSGRLNVTKAISVYHDVVDFGGTPRRLEFGLLSNPGLLIAACDKPIPIVDPKKLRKIIPNLSTADGTMLEYWTESGGKLSKRRCKQTSGKNLESFVTEGGGVLDPPLSDVKEIVFATLATRQ